MRLFLLSVSSFTLLSYPALADPAPVPARKPLEARVETNWRYGDERSILMTEFWVPIAQNVQDGSVLYGDLRMMGDDLDNREFNLGLGYRDMVRTALLGEGIAGAHIWFDRRLTDRGSTFNQVTLGGEWLGEEFDILANGYLPLSDEERHFAPNASPQGPELAGTGIFVDTLGTVLEEPQAGLDLESGWQVPAFEDHTDSVRIYGGGYYFDGPNTESVVGWRTRLAADITSDIQVGARFQKDDERGSQGFLEATIRFPFGNKKSFRDEGIRARLDDSPERDIDIVTGDVVSDAGERVQVLNTATGAPQEVLHVDNMAAGGGDGSIENPFNTLADAQAAASAHSIIYVHRGNGTTAGQNAGIALNQTGQQLIGSGTHFTYDGTRFTAANGAAVDPGSLILAAADPAGAPTITNAGGDGITVTADNINVAGITVDGAAGSGIMVEANGAAASAQNVSISNISAINNTRHGVYIHGADGGAVSAKVQRAVTMANSQHGIAVYDDTDDTFEVDLGGGSMGSSGNNVLAGNTLEDLAVEYDGRQLSAMHNWWGQAAGPDTDNPGIGIAPQIYYGAPINDGLVGHWTFDNEWLNGATAYDRSGNSYNGTLEGQQGLPVTAAGVHGEALQFLGDPDGPGGQTGSYVRTDNVVPLLHPVNEITILVLAQTSNIPENGTIVRARNSTYMLDSPGSGLRTTVNALYAEGYSASPFADTSFYQVAGSFSANQTVRYVNGSEVNTLASSAVTINDPVNCSGGANSSSCRVHIGARNDLHQTYWEGVIDDVRIYSRALDPEEISELYRMDTSSSVNTGSFLTSAP